MNFQVTSKYHMICDCLIPSIDPQTNDQTNLITSFIYGNEVTKSHFAEDIFKCIFR